MKVEKRFIYKNKLKWKGNKTGIVEIENKPLVKISTPPEFGGPEGFWSPEDLFVSSINSCLMTTFLYFTLKNNIELRDYISEAEGIVEKKDSLKFTQVRVNIKIKIGENENIQKIKTFIELAEKYCLISNSVNFDIKVYPEIQKEKGV